LRTARGGNRAKPCRCLLYQRTISPIKEPSPDEEIFPVLIKRKQRGSRYTVYSYFTGLSVVTDSA
jgi:hypothetical protein